MQRIFSSLLRYDRLQLSKLQRYSHVSAKQLYAALAVMVQMHLVYHFTSPEDGSTYYEANTSSAYNLIRAGKIVELVEDRLGGYAAKVMSSILYLGHVRISHLETLPELQPEVTVQLPSNGVNGKHHSGDPEEMDIEENKGNGGSFPNGHHISELHSTLRSLAAHGYIARVRDHQYQTLTDNLMDAKRVVKATFSDTTAKPKRQEAEILLKTEKMVDERLDGDLSRGLIFHGIPRGVKRRRVNGVSNRSNKRPRLESLTTEGKGEEEEEEGSDEDEYDDLLDDDDDIPLQVGLL
jgi:DNA-directed RNA polymerase III subunit RPC3